MFPRIPKDNIKVVILILVVQTLSVLNLVFPNTYFLMLSSFAIGILVIKQCVAVMKIGWFNAIKLKDKYQHSPIGYVLGAISFGREDP